MSGRELYGKYALLARVASGGMAEVWLAKSSSIGGFEKILAIKRMHPRLGANQGFVSLFIEEAKLSVSLNHPNIVQIFDFGRVDDNYYIAMEYVEGVDLATLAARARDRRRPIPVDACVYVMSRVFEGLGYAHTRRDRYGREAGIIHRDVSPHNVLASYEGQVKISDFGIAKAVEELKRSERGEVVGKVAYMSPEQARGEVITTAADIWGGGVILHEILANARLFARATDHETLHAVAHLPILPPSVFNPMVPPALDDIVIRILERDASRRPASAREVAEELGDVLRLYFPRTNELRLADVIRELWDGQPPMIVLALEQSRSSIVGRFPEAQYEHTQPEDEEYAALEATPGPAVAVQPHHEPTRSARPSVQATERRNSLSATDVRERAEYEASDSEAIVDPWALPPLPAVDQDEDDHGAQPTARSAPVAASPLAAALLSPVAPAAAAAANPAVSNPLARALEAPAAPQAAAPGVFGRSTSHVLAEALEGRKSTSQILANALPDAASAPRVLRESTSQVLAQALENAPPPHVAREVARLKRVFSRDPNLWVLVDVGDAYDSVGLRARALAAYELAAAKFAQQALLVQAVAIYVGLLGREGATARVRAGLRRLPDLPGVSDAELMADLLDPIDEAVDFSEFQGLFGEGGEPVEVGAPAPILGNLDPDLLERLAAALKLRRVPPSSEIIREGDPGESFFWIGRGRVVVSASNFEGRRIYLTSLADGDCFGEQSFFTGRPRDANVESMDEVLLLEIGKQALYELVDEFPAIGETLRQFFKDRIAESLLARSSLFGHLAVRDRRLLAARFQFTTCEAGDIILAEGEASDAFYAIKSGRVEVFSGHTPNEVELAVLKTGEVFGEIAALKGIARTASVRAVEPCELMKLEAGDLRAFLDQNQDIKIMLEAQIEARADQTARRMSDSL